VASDPSAQTAALIDALVRELASAMGGTLGVQATVAPASEGGVPEWALTVTIGGPAPGAVTIALSRADGLRLAQLASGSDAEPSDAVVAELLQELVGQAIGLLRLQPQAQGVLFCVESPGQAALPTGALQYYTVTLAPDFSPVVAVWQAADANAATAAGAPGAAAAAAQGQAGPAAKASAARRDQSAPPPAAPHLSVAPPPKIPANLDVILDIDLPLSVRFGQTHLTIDALTRLGPGSVLDLGRSPDDPVEVLVNGRLIAHAEVVVVSGHYGVRILEVVSAADRIRGLAV
jgi:flagellar motor switch protein FliN